MISGKAVIFGDPHTGKSLLIDRLVRSSFSEHYDSGGNLFSIVEFAPDELEFTSSKILLKVWENSLRDRSNHFTRSDEELACKGALFSIVTYDIRDPATAESVFKKWIPIKEMLSPESFLFIVGSFLDQSAHRRVDMKQMCKASAQKDAVYIEVSNYEGTNISLFRQLLIHRINHMLKCRQQISQQLNEENQTENDENSSAYQLYGDTAIRDHYHDWQQHGTFEQKSSTEYNQPNSLLQNLRPLSSNHIQSHIVSQSHSRSRSYSSEGGNSSSRQNHRTELSIPSLEQPIMCDSIGSILASCLDMDHWLGYDADSLQIREIGQGIIDLIDDFNTDFSEIDSIMQHPSRKVISKTDTNLPSSHKYTNDADDSEEENMADIEYVDSEMDLTNVQSAFQLLGLSFPDISALSEEQLRSPAKSKAAKTKKATSYLRKLAVKLPAGKDAEMVLDLESNIEQQIELFLLSNNIAEHADMRKKLIDVSSQLLEDYVKQVQQQQQQQQQIQESGHLMNGSFDHHHNLQSTSSPASHIGSLSSSGAAINRYHNSSSGGGGGGGGSGESSLFGKEYDDNSSVSSLSRRNKGPNNKSNIDICATRKCKVRINLSTLSDKNRKKGGVNQDEEEDEEEDRLSKEVLFIDVVVQKGDILSEVAERICRELDGSSEGDEIDSELKQKVLDQLILSC